MVYTVEAGCVVALELQHRFKPLKLEWCSFCADAAFGR